MSILRDLRDRHIKALLLIGDLEDEGVLPVLRDVVEVLGTRHDYAHSTLEDLKRWGLVEEVRVGRKGKIRGFRLTKKGRKLLEELRKI